MKIKKLYIAAGLACSLGFTSCELDEYNPSAGNNTIENFNTWEGLATYCYSSLSQELFRAYDFLSVAEGGSDMWLCSGASPLYAPEPMYYEGLTTSTNGTKKVFNQAYATIAHCNTVINHAESVTGASEAEKAQVVAEAKTLRAYFYLTLVTYYGPVTLTKTEVGDIDNNPVRSTVDEIYRAIEQDLKDAAHVLGTQPRNGQYARVTKKTAQGLLCRAYAQWAGEAKAAGNAAREKELWTAAKDAAEEMINNRSKYDWFMYPTVDDLWAQANNRNNKEALFIASGVNMTDPNAGGYYQKQNLFKYTMCEPGSSKSCNDLFPFEGKQNYYLGRTNEHVFAPSKYTMDVFDPSWDRRYENTFMTAFSAFSMVDCGWVDYRTYAKKIDQALIDKYGMGQKYLNTYLLPLVDMDVVTGGASNQYVFNGFWPKGMKPADYKTTQRIKDVKNLYVIDYPVAADDNRFLIVLSKEYKTKEQKQESPYFTVNIDDLYGGEFSTEYKSTAFDGTNSNTLFPSLIKFNWAYDGAWGKGLDQKSGDIMIMRMAEVYLIAAEAWQQLGDGSKAAPYLNILRNRAARPGTTAPQITDASEDDIFDEYAREMAGEYTRRALLKRHRAFETRLPKYNKRAAKFFKDYMYNMPIAQDFLDRIFNKEQYGDNGYGTTPSKGY
ncbi:RagB/SusD family nutrient uptake outer membrane protein [Palleniella muris]|uniref:RagB/SusD family nutrient uptake outer membrane protein n=1 Tax=Palleniella muris TaxID=3038145 RepID=A0AC61QQT4_9BACT|nr:RagB/SusD family nutrient uptake outer membrane protein [Palleniella muris]TGX82502.1 RagB/SusD family nutrient uptake outer membrane protein [Palleniella muris]